MLIMILMLMLQYLHYIGLGVQPRKTDVGSRLEKDQLPHIINPVEAYLGQYVSQLVIDLSDCQSSVSPLIHHMWCVSAQTILVHSIESWRSTVVVVIIDWLLGCAAVCSDMASLEALSCGYCGQIQCGYSSKRKTIKLNVHKSDIEYEWSCWFDRFTCVDQSKYQLCCLLSNSWPITTYHLWWVWSVASLMFVINMFVCNFDEYL